MKILVIAAILLFAGSAVGFWMTGLPAYAEGTEARADLDLRVASLAELLSRTSSVSHPEIDSFDQRLEDLTGLLDERLLLMLESISREQPPTLATVLTGSGPSWCSLESPMGRRLVELAAGRPRVDAALASTLEAIVEASAFALESVEPRDDGQLVPVRDVPQLTAYEAEFVVLCQVDQALQILESLAAEPGEPLLTVSAASLRRVEPALWPVKPVGLSSPPVRLWVTVTALFRTAPTRGGR